MTPSVEYLIYFLVFCAGFLGLQVVIGAGRQAAKRVHLANDRLRRLAKGEDATDVLARMKRSRSINADGALAGWSDRISKLVLQSGLPLGPYGIYIMTAVAVVALALLGFILKGTLQFAFVGAAIGAVLPLVVLMHLTRRRRKRAVGQLPEALDVIIRSLAAGHPVPVAMSLVAREMSDPIGSEFGIASDEVSFGSSISAAVQKVADRVGHDDFELFSAMIRLQERTGGNLAELLRANAKTIRDRQKMRLRIKAASAEGRMSALILNAAPMLLFAAVNLMNPEFYGEFDGHPLLTYALWGVVIWMGIGNLVMRRMINFKI